MCDYEHDIFISYRRMDDDWIRWTKENFVRPLRALLRPALGNVRIFFDEQIETGMSWPDYLARAHARSRLLIPLLSRDYFSSPWCRLELALMHHREQQLGLRSPANPAVLILPFIIDDGDQFPQEVQAMQGERIHKYANPWIRPDSAVFQEFAQYLQTWCPRAETARNSVPGYDSAWESFAHAQFNQTFRIQVQTQTTSRKPSRARALNSSAGPTGPALACPRNPPENTDANLTTQAAGLRGPRRAGTEPDPRRPPLRARQAYP
jgi:hypothetical protein